MNKTITIRLDNSLVEQLDHVTEHTHRTKSDIIRNALRRQLEIEIRKETERIADDSYPDPSGHDNGYIVSESPPDTTRERAFDFALTIIKLCKTLEGQRHYVLAKQLLRAGTSIGANIEEAGAAQSRKDFLHKMSIASKEARETNYWLRLIQEAEISPTIDFSTYLEDSLTLIRLLTAIVKTTAQKMRKSD